MQRISDWLGVLKGYLAHIHPDTLLGALILLAMFVVGGLVLSALLTRAIEALLERDRDQRIDRLTASFLTRFARVFLWLFIVMLYAHTVPALDRLGTALLTSVSIASVVIGLAAQSTLSNLVAGISLVFYKPFRLNDKLEVTSPGGVETGFVESVSLGYTILRTFDSRRIVVPNATIASAVLVNHSLVSPRTMAMVPFSIGYGSDIDRARAVAIELADAHADVEEVVSCPVVLLNASSVDLSLRAWCRDSGTAAGVRFDLSEAIKKRFDAEGIEIPFPYQNVVLVNGNVEADEPATR